MTLKMTKKMMEKTERERNRRKERISLMGRVTATTIRMGRRKEESAITTATATTATTTANGKRTLVDLTL
jgi:hypothetical protein